MGAFTDKRGLKHAAGNERAGRARGRSEDTQRLQEFVL
jgi:hypothetical protein